MPKPAQKYQVRISTVESYVELEFETEEQMEEFFNKVSPLIQDTIGHQNSVETVVTSTVSKSLIVR